MTDRPVISLPGSLIIGLVVSGTAVWIVSLALILGGEQ